MPSPNGKIDIVRLNIFCGYPDSNQRSPVYLCEFKSGTYHSVCRQKKIRLHKCLFKFNVMFVLK